MAAEEKHETIEVPLEVARWIRGKAVILGISEEAIIEMMSGEYFTHHADELQQELEAVAGVERSRRASRILKAILSPGGVSTLAKLYPPQT